MPNGEAPRDFRALTEARPLPEGIEKIRAGFGSLQRAWQVFHGNIDVSATTQKTIKQHVTVRPTTHTPENYEIHDKHISALLTTLGGGERTFERLAINNQFSAEREQLRLRVENTRPNPPPSTPERLALEELAHQREVQWRISTRLIRRTLQTADRYLVAQQRFAYPGFQSNNQLETQARDALSRLTAAMEARVKLWGVEGNAMEKADRDAWDAIVAAPDALEALYIDFLDRALFYCSGLRAQGRDAVIKLGGSEALYKRLPEDRTALHLEIHSFHFHEGLQNIIDMHTLVIPGAERIYNTVNAAPSTNPAAAKLTAAERKEMEEKIAKAVKEGNELINTSLDTYTEGFRAHFDAVLGRTRPGRPAPNNPGLLNTNLPGMDFESWWSPNGRRYAARLCYGLARFRGLVRQGVGTVVREAGAAPLRRVPLIGNWLADQVPEPMTADEYTSKHMQEITRAMGLPDGFNFSPDAWQRLENDQSDEGRRIRERFEKNMKSVRENIEKSREAITRTASVFEDDLTIFDTLRGKISAEHMRNARPDPGVLAWDNINLKQANALTREEGGRVLAAFLVLRLQMSTDWRRYSRAINGCAEGILRNIGVAVDIAGGANNAADLMQREDDPLAPEGGISALIYGAIATAGITVPVILGGRGALARMSSTGRIPLLHRGGGIVSTIVGTGFRGSLRWVNGLVSPFDRGVTSIVRAAQGEHGNALRALWDPLWRVEGPVLASPEAIAEANQLRRLGELAGRLTPETRARLALLTERSNAMQRFNTGMRVLENASPETYTILMRGLRTPDDITEISNIIMRVHEVGQGPRFFDQKIQILLELEQSTTGRRLLSHDHWRAFRAAFLRSGVCGSVPLEVLANAETLKSLSPVLQGALRATSGPQAFRVLGMCQESPALLARLNQLTNEAQLQRALRLLGSPALSSLEVRALTGEQMTQLARILTQGSIPELRGLVALSAEQNAVRAVLGMEAMQMSRILTLCGESASLRALLRTPEFVASLRVLTAAEAEQLIMRYAVMSISEATQFTQQLGRLLAPAERLAFVRQAAAPASRLGTSAGAAGRWGGRALGALGVFAEGWMLYENEVQINNQVNALASLQSNLRSILPAAFVSQEADQTFFHAETRTTISVRNIHQLAGQFLGTDYYRRGLSVVGILAAIAAIASPATLAAVAVLLVTLPIRSALDATETEQWSKLLNDLPPALLAFLPTHILRGGDSNNFLVWQRMASRRAVLNGLLRLPSDLQGHRERYSLQIAGFERAERRALFFNLYSEITQHISPQLLAASDAERRDPTAFIWRDMPEIERAFFAYLPGAFNDGGGTVVIDPRTGSGIEHLPPARFNEAIRNAALHYVRFRLHTRYSTLRDLTQSIQIEPLQRIQKSLAPFMIDRPDSLESILNQRPISMIIADLPGDATRAWAEMSNRPNLVEACERLHPETELPTALEYIGSLPARELRVLINVLEALPIGNRAALLRALAGNGLSAEARAKQREEILRALPFNFDTEDGFRALRDEMDAIGSRMPGGMRETIADEFRSRSGRPRTMNVEEADRAEPHAGAERMHPNPQQLAEAANKLLMAAGAVEVMTWVVDGRRESIELSRPEAAMRIGTTALHIRRGNDDVYVRMIENRLMWSAWGNPVWVPIEQGRYNTRTNVPGSSREFMNQLADDLMVLSRSLLDPSTRLDIERRTNEATAFLGDVANPDRARGRAEYLSRTLREEQDTRRGPLPLGLSHDQNAPAAAAQQAGIVERIIGETNLQRFSEENGIHTFCWRENWIPEDGLQVRCIGGQLQFRTPGAEEFRIWTRATSTTIPFVTRLESDATRGGLTQPQRAYLQAAQRLVRELAERNGRSGL